MASTRQARRKRRDCRVPRLTRLNARSARLARRLLTPPVGGSIGVACALAIAGCTVDAPVAHRADVRASYTSKYFRVDAPAGTGWEAIVRTAEHPFSHERELFTPWVPPRIGFVLHGWHELWPHSLGPEPTIEFRGAPADPSSGTAPVHTTLPDAKSAGERELAGLRWSTFASEPVPGFHIVEWLAIDGGVELGVRMRVEDATRGLPPPELSRVVAGVRRDPVVVSPTEAAIERGIVALWDLARAGGWNGDGWSESLVTTARVGTEGLRQAHPERYEGPFFDAALVLLEARQRMRLRSGFYEPVGPFEAACETRDGHVSTRAFSAGYDATRVRDSLRDALALAPGSFWSRYHLGIALVRAGDTAGGIRELSALADANPDDALAWFALSLAQRDAGDTRAALASARRAALANRKHEIFSKDSGYPGNTLIDDFFFGTTLIDELVRELRR